MPEKLKINLTEHQKKLFENYTSLFLQKNSQLNLISKNDEKFLQEKHILDSLALSLFLKPQKGETLLDIGTGGGFPSVPLSIFYSDLRVYAIDSIRKKVNAVEDLKNNLKLENLTTICDRVENVNMEFDYVVSRAVASVDKLLEYAIPKVKNNGYFIAYKSKKIEEELEQSKKIMKKYKLDTPKIIPYILPLEEIFERNLVIFKIKK